MSNNNRNQDRNRPTSNETAIGAAIVAAGAVPDGPANAADIITDMLEKQEEVLETIQTAKAVYGEVECNAKDGAVSERYGRKSCEVMEIIVAVPAAGIRIVGSLYANLTTKAEGTFVEFTAYVPPKSIKYRDSDAKDLLLATMEHAASNWHGYDKATASAEKRLLGQTHKIAGQLERPRLVKRMGLTQTA